MKRLAVSLALVALCVPAHAAPDDAGDAQPDLHTWGKLKPLKKTEFFELKYKDRSGRKPKAAKAFLTIDEGAEFFADQMIPLEALEDGASLWIYGKPQERESTDADGRVQVDRQIVNTLLVATGPALDVVPTKAKGPGGQEWLEATVSRPGKALRVTYEAQEYKLICLRGYSVVRRQELPKRPPMTKPALVEVTGKTSDALPEKSKEGDKAFSISRVVLLNKRLQKTAYPLLLP